MNNVTLKEAATFLRENDNYLIFSHASPDGDTLGSAVALTLILRKLGKNAFAYCPDVISPRLKFITENDCFVDNADFSRCLISVDIASRAMLGKDEEYFQSHNFELSFDHHAVNSTPTERLYRKEDYSSNGEVIYELMSEMNVSLDEKIANALYTAICSDSGGFKFSSVRPETYEYGAELIRAGADFVDIFRRLFEKKTRNFLELEKTVYSSIEFFNDGKIALVCLTNEMLSRAGATESDIDGISQIPRMYDGVLVSVFARPRGDIAKFSLRSNNDFDCASFAKMFGGGGHYHASGFRIEGDVLAARDVVVEKLCKMV